MMSNKNTNWFWYWVDGPASGCLEYMPCGLTIGSKIINDAYGKYEVVDILALGSQSDIISEDILSEVLDDLDIFDNNFFIILAWNTSEVIDANLMRHMKIGNILVGGNK